MPPERLAAIRAMRADAAAAFEAEPNGSDARRYLAITIMNCDLATGRKPCSPEARADALKRCLPFLQENEHD